MNAKNIIKSANDLKRQGKLKDAIEEYYRAIELNGNSAWSYYHLSECLAKCDHLDEAISALEKAIAIHPQQPWFHHKLGEVFLEKGQIQEAIACFSKAIEISPEFHFSQEILEQLLPEKLPQKLEKKVQTKFIFIWPLNPVKLKNIDFKIYQYNQIEKLKYFSKYFGEYYEFEFFNQKDFETGIPQVDYENDIILAHSPLRLKSTFTEVGLKNYLEVVTKSKQLYLMHPGSPLNYGSTGIEREIIQKCKHFILWAGKYWYDKLLESPQEESLVKLIGANRISRLEPALEAELIEFSPVFKPGRLSFLHVSNISVGKAPHRVLLSIPEQSELYIATEQFANDRKTFKLNYQETTGEETAVSFSYPPIHAFKGKTHQLTASVKMGNLEKNVIFHGMGYVKNWEKIYSKFIEENINYYLHLSFIEGLSAAVLEAAARGILLCVSAESGFLAPSVCYLGNDPLQNQKILESLAGISEHEYLERVTNLREFVLSEHCWEKTLKALGEIIKNG